MDTNIASELTKLAYSVNKSAWERPEFWISNILNLVGLALSGLAFWQASRARQAAVDAGRTVKGQSVAIELSEVAQSLDSVSPDITYREARDILSAISRRVRRVISPFDGDVKLGNTIAVLRDTLLSAQEALKSVRPSGPSAETKAPNAVYFAIENEFSTINNAIADFLGLLEKKTIERGADNGS